jgi:endonuclease/exonuclease/phosphatase family metal-dependent hydrolase
MALRLATFNVENLFERPRAMNLPDWKQGQPAIDAVHELNALFNRETWTEADQARILEVLEAFGLTAARPRNPLLQLRTIRGQLLRRTGGVAAVVARGRADWVGWAELKVETIADPAIENTARVIAEVDPDVLVLVEAEGRPALRRFCDHYLVPMLAASGRPGHDYDMVIAGNDDRGINLAILSRLPIERMRSHVADRADGLRIFSRDCPEYYLTLPGGGELLVLPNHFASKGSDFAGTRRRVQAARVRELSDRLAADQPLLVVAGDLNDHPQGGSLDALLDGPLQDAMALPAYSGLPGTYRYGNAREKLDYLLLSPELVARVRRVEVNRQGFYAPTKWKSFPNLTTQTKDRYQASDHHCLWVELDL